MMTTAIAHTVIQRLLQLDFVPTQVEIEAGAFPGAPDSAGVFAREIDGEYHVVTDCDGCLPHEGTLRFYVGMFKSKADYQRVALPGDSGILHYDLVRGRGGRPVFKLALASGGPVVAEFLWLLNAHLEVDAARLVAKMFALALHDDLTKEDMDLIVNLNRTPAYQGTCASKDFCDPQVQLDDVFSDISGDEENISALWSEVGAEAWKIARDAEFDVERI